MDALQLPHPLDKKTMGFDMAHISCPPHKDAAATAAALSCCFFLFYSSPLNKTVFSFAMHGRAICSLSVLWAQEP